VNEPFAHGLTLREEGQVELLGRRLNELDADAYWPVSGGSVNTQKRICSCERIPQCKSGPDSNFNRAYEIKMISQYFTRADSASFAFHMATEK
jgi:hypothetical protein